MKELCICNSATHCGILNILLIMMSIILVVSWDGIGGGAGWEWELFANSARVVENVPHD